MTIDSRPTCEVADPKVLRRAFGAFATGVTVVTVGGAGEHSGSAAPDPGGPGTLAPHGMTANSFSSVSLDPPLLLVCVDRTAIMHHSMLSARRFAVSVLAADQEEVARHFANRWRPLGAAQFDEVDWVPGPHTGAPLICGALAWFECELWRAYDGGDHTIFVGSLLSVDKQQEQDAVLFFHGRFRRLTPEASEVTT